MNVAQKTSRATEGQNRCRLAIPVVDCHERGGVEVEVDPLEENIGAILGTKGQCEVLRRTKASTSFPTGIVQDPRASFSISIADKNLREDLTRHDQKAKTHDQGDKSANDRFHFWMFFLRFKAMSKRSLEGTTTYHPSMV